MARVGNVVGGGAEGGSFDMRGEVLARQRWLVIDPNSSWTTFTNMSWLGEWPSDKIGGTIDDLPTRQRNRYVKWRDSKEGKAALAEKGKHSGKLVKHRGKYYTDF